MYAAAEQGSLGCVQVTIYVQTQLSRQGCSSDRIAEILVDPCAYPSFAISFCLVMICHLVPLHLIARRVAASLAAIVKHVVIRQYS
eukprot:scaffold270026_cov18-Prasinocladus_malaysianus.AAC.1